MSVDAVKIQMKNCFWVFVSLFFINFSSTWQFCLSTLETIPAFCYIHCICYQQSVYSLVLFQFKAPAIGYTAGHWTAWPLIKCNGFKQHQLISHKNLHKGKRHKRCNQYGCSWSSHSLSWVGIPSRQTTVSQHLCQMEHACTVKWKCSSSAWLQVEPRHRTVNPHYSELTF